LHLCRDLSDGHIDFYDMEFCGKRNSAGARSPGNRTPRIQGTPPPPPRVSIRAGTDNARRHPTTGALSSHRACHEKTYTCPAWRPCLVSRLRVLPKLFRFGRKAAEVQDAVQDTFARVGGGPETLNLGPSSPNEKAGS
jgi:hypothetical protein